MKLSKNINASYIDMVLTVAIDIGKAMLSSGAEVNRVEDTIERICLAYGCTEADVFSITSEIIVTVRIGTDSYTQSKRIRSYTYNLKQLEELNRLSREICEGTPDPNIIHGKIEEIVKVNEIKLLKKYFGYIIAVSAFTILFGGGVFDAIASVSISSLIFFLTHVLKKANINFLAHVFIVAILAGFLAVGLKFFLGFLNIDVIIIGNVMVLIPAVAFTNGVRDLLGGDIASGLLRISESVLVSIAIAVGFAIPLIILGGAL